MTVTIKEITDKFYEVIDRYKEHEDWWEESEIKPKKEHLIPFRNELEQVAVNYLEETDDTDDFVTAFAAFCTCVIRYDLVERDDWTYYDALKSIVASMSEKIFPEYFDECDDFRELLEGICYVIVYNDYANDEFFDKLIELYAQWNYSVLGLFLFCLYACYYDEENDNKMIAPLKIINNHITDDTRDYALGMNLYAQSRDISINEASYRHLLPFCFFAPQKELVTNAILPVYETVKNRLGYQEDDKIDIPNLCKHFVNMTEGNENEQRITSAYFFDLFDKLDTLKKTPHDQPAWYDGYIDRNMPLFYKNLAMHIPAGTASSTRLIYDDILLDKALEEKTKAMEDKEKVIRGFSHRFKNMRTTSLYNVAKALLAMDDKDLKKWGRTVLLEYGVKENIIKAVEMLQLRYENEHEQLLTIIHESQSKEADNCNNITEVVNKAITRCITTLVHDGSDEPRSIRKNCFKKEELICIRNSFEEDILFEDNPDIISWTKAHVMPVSFRFSDSWLKLYFKKDRGLDIILTDLMVDLIMNALKYAKRSEAVNFSFSENEDFLMIVTENMSVEKKDNIPGSNMGLRSQNDILNFINRACGYDADSLSTMSLSNGLFRTEVKLSKKLFSED